MFASHLLHIVDARNPMIETQRGPVHESRTEGARPA